MKKKIIVSVISDLVTDQRVHKVCTYLHNRGFDVTLIGRMHSKSLPLQKRIYSTERIFCYFSKGTLFYAEFMTKLFLKILFKKASVFLANDLDTLLPNFLVSLFRKKKLVYDSHEYFTGMPELQATPFKKKIWHSLEKIMLPKIKHAYTVNRSIANLYQTQYNIDMKVVRNVPYLQVTSLNKNLVYPVGKTILLLQGSGINEGRGAEELIESMQILPDNFMLYFIGSGNCWNKLKMLAGNLKLNHKIIFIEKIPFPELPSYTQQAHLGLSLDKPFCLNYELSLPNKIFDYIHAGIPVLASEVTEVKNIIENYNVGMTINEVSPKEIANAVLKIFENKEQYQLWKNNTYEAAKNLCWQKEEKVLEEIFNNL